MLWEFFYIMQVVHCFIFTFLKVKSFHRHFQHQFFRLSYWMKWMELFWNNFKWQSSQTLWIVWKFFIWIWTKNVSPFPRSLRNVQWLSWSGSERCCLGPESWPPLRPRCVCREGGPPRSCGSASCRCASEDSESRWITKRMEWRFWTVGRAAGIRQRAPDRSKHRTRSGTWSARSDRSGWKRSAAASEPHRGGPSLEAFVRSDARPPPSFSPSLWCAHNCTLTWR